MSKVSICIPTYNGARYLDACLASVLSQTYQDIEILTVDDGSADATFEILGHYAASDERVRLVRNESNLGLVGNWNRCVELASGEWIKFVFQDDLIAPDCIEHMMSAADPEIPLVACSRGFLFEPDTPQEVQNWYLSSQMSIEQQWQQDRAVSALEFCQATLEHPGANLVGEPSSVLLRRNVFERYGLFNPFLIMSCDLEYWTRVAVNTGFAWLSDRLATFRVHKGATSASNRAGREYRMNILDDLIILHEFAFDPLYAPLRRAAGKGTPPIDLSAAFLEKAVWAKNAAKHYRGLIKSTGRLALEEWQLVARQYPRIASPRGGILGRLF